MQRKNTGERKERERQKGRGKKEKKAETIKGKYR